MSKLPDVVRMKVDAMRSSSTGAHGAQVDAIKNLASMAERSARAADSAARGVTHLCPWNTCQATKHN